MRSRLQARGPRWGAGAAAALHATAARSAPRLPSMRHGLNARMASYASMTHPCRQGISRSTSASCRSASCRLPSGSAATSP
eukprot:4777111-Prymnesium_polylepis.2